MGIVTVGILNGVYFVVVMLIGHLLGDFYLQSDSLVKKRKKCKGYVLLHGLIYTLCMSVAFGICVRISDESIFALIILCFGHLLIDMLKSFFDNPKNNKSIRKDTVVFFADQASHIINILLVSILFSSKVQLYSYVTLNIAKLPNKPLMIILGLLCILKPIDIIISNFLFGNKNSVININPLKDLVKSGRIIGYLERIIIFILMQFGAFSAIAFVLTAKSVARFKELEQEERAKYYLIGTLFSACSVIVIAFVLGLCNS